MAKKAKVKNWREFFESDPKELPLADMNVRDEIGRTMLIGAARSSADVVRRIIEAGADVNAKTDNGETALMVAAAANENPAVVETLIKAGADIEIKTNDGGTALMFAVSNNENPAVTEALLKAGANVNVKVGEETLLTALIKRKDDSDEEEDFDDEEDFDEEDASEKAELFERRRMESIEMLIKAGADIEAKNDEGMTPLLIAAMFDKPQIVRLLAKAGADVEAVDDLQGMTVLHHALWVPYVSQETVKALINAGANVNDVYENGDTALILAAARGKSEIVKLLLDKGFDVNQANGKGTTALMKAAAGGKNAFKVFAFSDTKWRSVEQDSIKTVKLLLKRGADVNAVDKNGNTALQYVREADYAQVLLEKGADIYTKNKNGKTLLMGTANVDYVRFLIDKGLDVNAADKNGKTALHYVTADFKENPEGMLDILFALLKARATADVADCNGDTALMTLAELSRFKRPIEFTKKAIKALLDAGADPHRENKKGKSALSLAEKAGNAEIVKMLK